MLILPSFQQYMEVTIQAASVQGTDNISITLLLATRHTSLLITENTNKFSLSIFT
jgi:hypothetical protein